MDENIYSPLNEEQVTAYHKDGYLVLRDTISKNETSKLQKIVAQEAQEKPYPSSLNYPEPAKYTVGGNRLSVPGLASIAEHPIVISALESLLKQEVYLTAFVAYLRTSGATGNGLNLYNIPDYEGHDHPPLIGFGLDGVALYGRYESSYARMDGSNSELDLFGGHEHGDYNYHYHAHSVDSSELRRRNNYTIHVLLRGAWAGKIGPVPDFWDNKKVATKGKSIYTGEGGASAR